MDEIGEMAFELQAKLLRILETGEYIKIGDTKPTRVNVRIIAATNRNLSQEIVAGRFREDLFYRLSVFQIHLPPLRERAGDIRLLAKAFIKSFAEQLARPVVEIAPAFLEALDSQPWKGNIRELRNVIERSMIVCESGYLDIADLPLIFRMPIMNTPMIQVPAVLNFQLWNAGTLPVYWSIQRGIRQKQPGY